MHNAGGCVCTCVVGMGTGLVHLAHAHARASVFVSAQVGSKCMFGSAPTYPILPLNCRLCALIVGGEVSATATTEELLAHVDAKGYDALADLGKSSKGRSLER